MLKDLQNFAFKELTKPKHVMTLTKWEEINIGSARHFMYTVLFGLQNHFVY